MFVAASPVSHARLGLVVPKHRHNSVQRNLVKRRLREIGRTVREDDRLVPALLPSGDGLLVAVRR